MNTHDQLHFKKVDEVKIIYQSKTPASLRLRIANSNCAKKAFLDSWNVGTIEHHESFRILLLNRANRALGIITISNGGISGTVIDVRQIFQAAIKSNCSSIIACHNHPSGNRNPSDADIEITKKISKAGKILDIRLLDHIIVTPENEYFSFADEGLL